MLHLIPGIGKSVSRGIRSNRWPLPRQKLDCFNFQPKTKKKFSNYFDKSLKTRRYCDGALLLIFSWVLGCIQTLDLGSRSEGEVSVRLTSREALLKGTYQYG
jgi:hypothetical protein